MELRYAITTEKDVVLRCEEENCGQTLPYIRSSESSRKWMKDEMMFRVANYRHHTAEHEQNKDFLAVRSKGSLCEV